MPHPIRIGPNANDHPDAEALKYIQGWKSQLPKGKIVTVSYLQQLGAGDFERVANQIIAECEQEHEDMPLRDVKLRSHRPVRKARKEKNNDP